LSQEGVSLARSVGETMEAFSFVATSTLPRAYETAIAMGFAVNEQVELMNTYGAEIEARAPWPMPYYHYSVIVKENDVVAKYANQLAFYYQSIMQKIIDGESALVVNHGGVVELGVVACLPNENFLSWGDEASYCEGARLFWENGDFVSGEVLRVTKNK
jgi:broad specificity phosphatase PhoE